VEYCYINPVKHGLVRRVCDWPFSSFHRDVAAGLFPENWAGDFGADGKFGEAEMAQ
jgi:putative transposase